MKLSERWRKILPNHPIVLESDIVEVEALEASIAAKNAEIIRYRKLFVNAAKLNHEHGGHTSTWESCGWSTCQDARAALAETPAAPDAAIIGPDGKGSATGANPLAAPEVK